MIRNRKKDDHPHFAIQTSSVQVGVKIKPRSHESRPKAECPAQVIGRKHAVVDALERDADIWVGHEFSLLNSRVYISSGTQTRCDLSNAACLLPPRKVMQNGIKMKQCFSNVVAPRMFQFGVQSEFRLDSR